MTMLERFDRNPLFLPRHRQAVRALITLACVLSATALANSQEAHEQQTPEGTAAFQGQKSNVGGRHQDG